MIKKMVQDKKGRFLGTRLTPSQDVAICWTPIKEDAMQFDTAIGAIVIAEQVGLSPLDYEVVDENGRSIER